MTLKVVFDSGVAGSDRIQVNDEITLTYTCEHYEPIDSSPYFKVNFETEDPFEPQEGIVYFDGTNSRVDKYGHVFYLL
ncbi:hypothetical protein [uncultured Marinococcus sp.]|uniref:hypothetical protein n=1 Tax=uncultured Marinococcus sp. TaxID=487012 RepID=UPI002624720F|nr:hypothetical protein [uncultured Marinococcus sp.]